MMHPELIADCDAALRRLDEEERSIRLNLDRIEREARADRRRLDAIDTERAAWTSRKAVTQVGA